MSIVPGNTPVDVPEPPARLVTEWAACGIVAAAARFIPVPLLDDAVRERSTRVAVLRTLRAAGRDFDVELVEAVYAGVDGALGGIGRYLRSVPRRVLLFPVRKYVALFGSVKGVPTDVMTVLLLSRSLHRELARGRLTGPKALPETDSRSEAERKVQREAEEQAIAAEAIALRRAVDATLGELDLRLISGAVAESLSRGRSLTRAAVQKARNLLDRDDRNHDPAAAVGPDDGRPDELGDPGGEVAIAAGSVAGALRRKDVMTVLAEYDARVDARLHR